MAEVDEQKKAEVEAQPKSDQFKTNTIIVLSVALIAAAFWHFKYSKTLILTINGTQLMVIAALLVAFLYWYTKKQEEPMLPQKDIVAKAVADWHFQAGYGFIDFTKSEVEVLTDKRALVFYPDSMKVFEYVAGLGVMSERWLDIDQKIQKKERSDLLRTYSASQVAEEKIKQFYEQRGFTKPQ